MRSFLIALCFGVLAAGCATTAPQPQRVIYVERPTPIVVSQSPIPTQVVVVERAPSWQQMLPRVDLRIDSRRSESHHQHASHRSSVSNWSRGGGRSHNSWSSSRSSRNRNDGRVRLNIDDIFGGLAGRR
ncbi:MAG: hypothetical protein WCX70_00380 [Candidatus Paceibacterota bacterium]|jgi:hypothetical protein